LEEEVATLGQAGAEEVPIVFRQPVELELMGKVITEELV
jgi:hypothetical protein